MKTDYSKMSLEQINRELRILLMPEEVFLILDNDFQDEYIELLQSGGIDSPKQIIEYVLSKEGYIDKEKLLLFTLKNAIEFGKRKTLDVSEIFSYDQLIEKLRTYFEGKRFSIFRLNMDRNTKKIDQIEELIAEELCAINDLDPRASDKEKRVQKRREETYNNLKARREKKEKANLLKIEELTKEVDLRSIVEVIELDDVSSAFVEDPELGALLRWKISKNSLLKVGIDETTIDELDRDGTLEDTVLDEYSEAYYEELGKTIKEYAAFIDVDKLLLTSACRYVLMAERDILEPETLENMKKYFEIVLDKLEKKKTRVTVIVDSEELDQIYEIRYSEKDLKEQLKFFIEPGVYLGEALKEKTKQELLTNKINLLEVNPKIMEELKFGEDEFVLLMNNSPENFIYIVDHLNLKREDVKIILEKVIKLDTKMIDKFVKEMLLNQEDIVELYQNGKIEKQQIFDIAEKEIIDDSTIIKIYNAQKEGKFNENLVLNQDELLEYFNINKLEQYIKNNEIEKVFLDFYEEILPEDENAKKEILSKINNLLKENGNEELNQQFYLAGLVETKDLKDMISENKIISMYEEEQIDFNKLIEIYNNDLITETSMNLLVDVYGLSEQVIEKLDFAEISIEKVNNLELELKENYIFDRYMQKENGFITPYPAIIGLSNRNIDMQQLNRLYNLGKVKEEDLFEYAKKGFLDQKIIRDIYINSFISDEKLEELYSDGIISEKSKEIAKKSRNMGQISKNIDPKLGMNISDDGIEIEEKIILPLSKLTEEVEREVDIYRDGTTNYGTIKKVIDPAIRDEKIRALGAKRIKRECVEYDEENPFNDYEFYIIPTTSGEITPNCVVIAERYYEDKFSDEKKLIDGNATYLFKLGDLTRISKKSKPEIIALMQENKDKTIKRLSHSKYWSKNLDGAIEKISGKGMKSRYTPEELKKINTINELIDGFEDPTNNNEYTRPFDIYY